MIDREKGAIVNTGVHRRLAAVALALGMVISFLVTTGPAAAEPTENYAVPNHSFETAVAGDGSIDGWSPLWAAELSISDARATDGDHSLHFIDPSATVGAAVVSDPIPVTPGAHRLQLDLSFESGTMNSMLYLLDSAGQRVGSAWVRWDPTPGSWGTQTWRMDIPDGVAQAQIVMNTVSNVTTDVYADNVRFGPVPPAQGAEESLGTPMTELISVGVGYTVDSAGRALGLTIANGEPSLASVVDINTGELITTREMPSGTAAWAQITAPDRSIYLSGAGGKVWRFTPDDLAFELVADSPLGQTYLWAVDITDSGRLVWASYPGGKVISYDPVSDSWRDHGVVSEGNTYVRSLDVVGNIAYVGVGAESATVAAVDLTTDEVTVIANPASEADQEFAFDLDVRDNLMFVRYYPSNTIHVYDLETSTWIDQISEAGWGLGVSPVFETRDGDTVRREVMVIVEGGRAIAYDLDSGAERSTCLQPGGGARMWSTVALPIEGMSDQVLVTARSEGTFYTYDPVSGTCEVLATEAQGTPVPVRVLATGPVGDIYMGGKSFVRLDPDTDETTKLPLSGQVQGIGTVGNLVVFGTYTGAGINVYDPTRPLEPGVNPRPRIRVGHDQDRPISMTAMGNSMAIGTFPVPGRLGGALAILETDTMELKVYDNIIHNQSIFALQYRDGLLYGGSGITGGLGQEPTETEGKLFIVDPETGEVVFDTVPVPGDGHVSALTFDDQGYLWGVTANSLFKFDPRTREVVERRRYFNTNDSRAYLRGRELHWHNGRLVGSTSGNVFEVDPATWEMTVIATGTANFAIDDHGRYYYGQGSELLRWTPFDARPACDVTLTEDHSGPLEVSGETVCATDVTIDGTVTVTDGGSLVMINSQLLGALRTQSAATVEILRSQLEGPVTIEGTTTRLRLVETTITGPVRLDGNTPKALTLQGNQLNGPLSCRDNNPALHDQVSDNEVNGPRHGQCAG